MNLSKPKNKLVTILGPTASGKSSLAIKLAKKFKGEIISADSRQVYKGMDLGSGKVTKNEQKSVPHHLLDVASPKRQFTVSQFKDLAQKTIKEIANRNRLPFLVGGTAFYIYSLIDDWNLPTVKPNAKLRKELSRKTVEQLYKILKNLDPERAKTIDANNPVRIMRAIEIVKTTGKPVPIISLKQKQSTPLLLGIKTNQDKLYKSIDKRLEQRLKQGLVKEVQKLLKSGVSYIKLEKFGLEYKFVSLYLRNKLTYDDMVSQLKNAIHHFAKRQMTWFKRDKRIIWVENQKQAEKAIAKYLTLSSKSR